MGDSILDNAFTKRSDLFGNCKQYNITTKTNHIAVILPPETKLKPIRRKVQIRVVENTAKNAYSKHWLEKIGMLFSTQMMLTKL